MKNTGDVDHTAGTTVGGAAPATLVASLVPQSQRLWLPPTLNTWPPASGRSGPTPAGLASFGSPDAGRVTSFTATNDAIHYGIPLDEDDIAYDGSDIEVWLVWTFRGTGNLPGDEVKWELSIGTYKADGTENTGTGGSWGLTTTKTIDIGGLTEYEGKLTLLGTYTGGAVGDELLGLKLLRPAQSWTDLTLSMGLVLVRA